jgi:hypothetical protein
MIRLSQSCIWFVTDTRLPHHFRHTFSVIFNWVSSAAALINGSTDTTTTIDYDEDDLVITIAIIRYVVRLLAWEGDDL